MAAQHHISTVKFNLQIFGVLIALTILTAASDYLPLGRFHLLVALIIASTKATLVVLYFMHLRWSPKLNWAFAGMSLFFLLLLIGMTFDDFLTRQWIHQPSGWTPVYSETHPAAH